MDLVWKLPTVIRACRGVLVDGYLPLRRVIMEKTKKRNSMFLTVLLLIAIAGCSNEVGQSVTTEKFTVTFDKNTQTDVKNMPAQVSGVVKGAKISKPSSDPVRNSGKITFEGWLKPDKTALWDFTNDTVNSDITLYALWGPEVIAERNYFAESNDNFSQWEFTAEELDDADYFTFQTDSTISGAKENGFGGIKIGFQNSNGSFGMSSGLTTLNWTPFAGRSTGKCVFVIKLNAIENYKIDNGDYAGTTKGSLRIYLGYWPHIKELAPNGYASLVKGEIFKSLYSIDLKLIETGGTIGFVYHKEP